MKLALYGLHRGACAEPEVLARLGLLAEDVGFEGLWVGDHIALPSDGSQEPVRLEAVVTLTYLAAVTTRIGLGLGVLVLPQRQPVLLAKQLSSLDFLSGGRLTVGVGAGWIEPELNAMGVALAERAGRVDEYLAALRVLWDEPEPAFTGEFVSFAGVSQRPRPVQRPHPPIVVGGHAPAALRRAVRHGNGWYGWDLDVEATAAALAKLRDIPGRPAELGELEITITPPAVPDVATARRYADLGVHRLVLEPDTMDASAMAKLIAAVGETLVDQI
ncbi:TIGR03619 family F420-dependent LLM class oxidoreductase [Actinophytocola sp.]|uniref:TIGR03619 family F420-dependent LLM class oxidoreductase n=1 Tax=Actinophytocola sp. TaxID=1872138 RepID=UPI00389AC59F